MKRNFTGFLQAGLAAFDIITLNILTFLSYLVYDSIPDAFYASYSKFAIALNLIWIVASWLAKLYHENVQ
jgi:hypothetical protein